MTGRIPVRCVDCGHAHIACETDGGEVVLMGVTECSDCGGTAFDEVTSGTLGMNPRPRSGSEPERELESVSASNTEPTDASATRTS